MLAIRQTVIVPADHILHLKVPSVPKGEEVEVFIHTKNEPQDIEAKYALLAQAATDPLFLSDVEEITRDFSFVDTEHI